MILIPAGSFHMGSTEWPPDRQPVHKVMINSFYIDKFKTTNQDYVEFINAQGNPGSAYINAEKSPYITKNEDKYTVVKGKENIPVSFVSWYGADAYCRWREKRLPTEAEWEYAARGPSSFKYPWGNFEPSKKYLSLVNSYDINIVLSEVGSYPDGQSHFGVLDLSGNVWEWCKDKYNARYYTKSSSKNSTGPEKGEHHILRGGQAGIRKIFLESSYRNHNVPGMQSPFTGCRCALTKEEDSTH